MIRIDLPIKTVNVANVMEHWRTRHRRNKAIHELIGLKLNGKAKPALPVHVTLTRRSKGTLDKHDNLPISLKPCADAVAKWLGIRRRPANQLLLHTRARPDLRRPDRSGAAPLSRLKSPPVRSSALREACRAIPCQVCGADDGTVCAMHGNEGAMGKGLGMKASDARVASGCWRCHRDIDSSSQLTQQQRRAMWWRAHCRTVDLLVRRGLWPPDVPIPDTTMPEELPAHVPLTTTKTWEDPFQ